MPHATLDRVALKNCWPYFLVSDLEASEQFCRQKLGFDVAYEEPDHGMAIFCRDEAYLILRQTKHDPSSLAVANFHRHEFPRGTEPYDVSIQVTNIRELYDEFCQRGADPTPLADLPFAHETAVRLPDGYLIVFMQLKSD